MKQINHQSVLKHQQQSTFTPKFPNTSSFYFLTYMLKLFDIFLLCLTLAHMSKSWTLISRGFTGV